MITAAEVGAKLRQEGARAPFWVRRGRRRRENLINEPAESQNVSRDEPGN